GFLQHGSRDLRLPVTARRALGDCVERPAAQRVDVADDSLTERLNVERDVVGHELLGPIATSPAQARPDVGTSFVERESREALVGGARERAAVVLRQQVGDELLAARQREEIDDGATTQPRLHQSLDLAKHGSGETLDAVGHDERDPAVAGLVAKKYFENVA